MYNTSRKARNLKRLLSLVCLSGLLVSPLAAETATLSYVSEPGDYIGQGQSVTYTEADGSFGASSNFDNGVNISFDHATSTSIWWDLSFAAPFAVELTPGYYPNAQRFPFQDNDRPGLSFSGSGRGCNTLTGEFTVADVAVDWYGIPRRFSASLEQHCEGGAPALFADIDYDFGGIGPTTFTAGNILVTYKNLIQELTPSGAVVQTIPIMGSDGTPATENARDLFYDDFDQLHLFNGTFNPVLSSFEPASGDWRHDAFSGWGIFNNVSYGGIASFWRFVFVTDQTSPSGIVRFDAFDDYSGLRFADGKNYIDLNIGRDDYLLYALRSDENTVDIYDPVTPTLLATVVLAQDVRGIALSSTGEIFGASWDGSIYHFDPSGALLNSLAAGIGSLIDIDLDGLGQIVVGARSDKIATTDESLTAVSTVTLGSSFKSTFVAFVDRLLDPSVEAAIHFVDGQGTSTLEVFENDVARVQVTSPWDDLDPGLVDTVTVHLASLYADDFETLVLSESAPGVFTGEISLAFGAATIANGTLETANSGAPFYLSEQLIANFATLDRTASTIDSRAVFVDSQGSEVVSYALRSTVRVSIEAPNRNTAGVVNAFNVVLRSQSSGDEETVQVVETSPTSGIFEGSILSSESATANEDGLLTATSGDTVEVEITHLNDPGTTTAQVSFGSQFAPTVVDDNVSTVVDRAVTLSPLANDSDPESQPLTINGIGSATSGSVVLNPDDSVTYTPQLGFIGVDSFVYVAVDTQGGESLGTVTVTVNANTPPTVTITSPTVGAHFTVGDAVNLIASATDLEDGDLSAALSWSSDLDGALGAGGSLTTSSLSIGVHSLTAQVIDSHGAPGSDQVSIRILSLPVQVVFTSIGAEDGWVRESSETSDVGGASNSSGRGSRALRPGDARQDRQYKSIVSFDTSSLPPGVIVTQATLRLRRGQQSGSNAFNVLGNLVADIQTGGFGGDTALAPSDFEAPATATAVAILSPVFATGEWSEGDLDAAGKSAVSLDGTTQLRVSFELDDNDDNGNDYMGFYSADNANSGNHPQLVVSYQQ